MPPKKLSKAEKERLKREEEERKRLEEEEARLKAEQDERERLAKEKEEAEERKRIEKEELSKRKVELDILRNVLDELKQKLKNFHDNRRRNSRWHRYMLCDKSPDPSIPQEINTYMNLWRENQERVTIDNVLEDGELTLRLISELEFLRADTPEEEKMEATEEYMLDTMRQLKVLMQEKLDRASHEMLLRASGLADTETANLQNVWNNAAVTLCLWGNLSKNPRVKNYDFTEQGISFEIPKLLTLTDCAYRILFLKYDHLSYMTKSFHKYPKQPEAEDGDRKDTPALIKEPTEDELQPEEVVEESKEPTSLDLMAELHNLDDEEKEVEEEKEEKVVEEEIEPPEEDLAPTPEIPEYEFFDGDDDAMDMRCNQIVGGVFYFDLLTLPPQPKQARGWTMTRIVEPPELCRLDYDVGPGLRPNASNLELSKTTHSSQQSLNAGAAAAAGGAAAPAAAPTLTQPSANNLTASNVTGEEKKKDERPPILVTRKLPASLCFIDPPVVARWEPNSKQWRTESIEVVTYKEEERELIFKTAVFGPMALFQDSYVNFPFQSWELRPLGENHCCLTIIAAVIELTIEVKDNKCAVVVTEEEEEKNQWSLSLKDVWMTVPQLVEELRYRGINVFGRSDSLQNCDTTKKSPLVESRVYEQMSLLSSSVAFAFSRWNRQQEDKHTVYLQAVEHLEIAPVNEDDFKLYCVTRKKVVRLRMSEFDADFDPTVSEDSSFHADLYNTYLETASNQGKDRVMHLDPIHFETVCSLLGKTRPLVFA